MSNWKNDFKKYIFPNDPEKNQRDKACELKFQHLPSRLFKYCSFNESFDTNNEKHCYDKENLERFSVWLSKPENLNDPYECKTTYTLGTYHLDESIEKETKNSIKDSLKKETVNISRKISDIIRKSTLLTSFTEKNDSIIMWSHYADNHKGFCVEYNFKKLGIDNQITKILYPVLYSNELPNINKYLKNIDNYSHMISLIVAISKSNEWKYEKEWRLIFPYRVLKEEQLFSTPFPSAIYIGANITSENEKWMKDFSQRKKIKLYKEKICDDEFKITFEKVF